MKEIERTVIVTVKGDVVTTDVFTKKVKKTKKPKVEKQVDPKWEPGYKELLFELFVAERLGIDVSDCRATALKYREKGEQPQIKGKFKSITSKCNAMLEDDFEFFLKRFGCTPYITHGRTILRAMQSRSVTEDILAAGPLAVFDQTAVYQYRLTADVLIDGERKMFELSQDDAGKRRLLSTTEGTLWESMHDDLDALPTDIFFVVWMITFWGLTQGEVAASLGVSISTVRRRWGIGRKLLNKGQINE